MTVVFTPKDPAYAPASKQVKLTVEPAAVDKLALTPASAEYNAADQTSAITANAGKLTLSANDYEATYTLAGKSVAAPNRAGEYTVTVTGHGNYTGSKTASFTITQATPTVSGVTVKTPTTIFPTTKPTDVELNATTSVPRTLELDPTEFKVGANDYRWTFVPTDTADYRKVTGTVRITVAEDNITGLKLDKAPLKLAYKHGDKLDKNGMKLTVTYKSGGSETLEGNALGKLAVGYNHGDAFTTGDTSVTLRLGGQSVELSGITVSKADSPSISQPTVSGPADQVLSGDIDLKSLLPKDVGTTSYEHDDSWSRDVFDTVTLKDGRLSYVTKAQENAANATVNVRVSMSNYADVTVTLTQPAPEPGPTPTPSGPYEGALDAVISQAGVLDSDDYTDASWEKLRNALDHAQAVRDDNSSTQGEVDAAAQAVRDAIDALGRFRTPRCTACTIRPLASISTRPARPSGRRSSGPAGETRASPSTPPRAQARACTVCTTPAQENTCSPRTGLSTRCCVSFPPGGARARPGRRDEPQSHGLSPHAYGWWLRRSLESKSVMIQ